MNELSNYVVTYDGSDYRLTDIYFGDLCYWIENNNLIACYETVEDSYINNLGEIVFESNDYDQALHYFELMNGD